MYHKADPTLTIKGVYEILKEERLSIRVKCETGLTF